jgi:hypothetical protein
MPVLAAGASSGHTPGLMFDVSSIPGQLWQRGIHCVGAQALDVTFLVNDTVYPPVTLYERTGVQLSVQLAGGVYAVVKGIGLQLSSQNAANSRCPSAPVDAARHFADLSSRANQVSGCWRRF